MQHPNHIISRIDTAFNWVLTGLLSGCYFATGVFRHPPEIETAISFFVIIIFVFIVTCAATIPYWLLLWWLHDALNKRQLSFRKYWILQNSGHLVLWGLLVCSTIVFLDRFLIVLLWPVAISSFIVWNSSFLRSWYSKKHKLITET